MNEQGDPAEPQEGLLDEELEQVTGGTGLIAHELTHTLQQGSSVGTNETITIGTNRTE
jgi:hypothetical protein